MQNGGSIWAFAWSVPVARRREFGEGSSASATWCRWFPRLWPLSSSMATTCPVRAAWYARYDAFEHIGEPGQWIDIVQLRRLDQGGDDCPMLPAAVGTGKQGILSTESDRAHGPFDGVGVELQAAVIEEQDQPAPVVQCVSDRLGQSGTTGDAAERFRQPCLHRLDEWTAALLAHPSAFLGGLATDLGLDLVERGNLAQGFLGERRLNGGVDVIELAPRMGPTESQLGDIAHVCDQAAKSGVAVDLEKTTEPLQMGRRMLALTVLAIDIGSGRMPRSRQGRLSTA